MPSALVSTPASLVSLAWRSGAARRVRTSAHASARVARGSCAALSSPGASVASPRGFLALDRAMPATAPSTRRRATRSSAAVRATDGDAVCGRRGGPINLPTALTVRVAAVPLVTVISTCRARGSRRRCAIFVLAAVTDWPTATSRAR